MEIRPRHLQIALERLLFDEPEGQHYLDTFERRWGGFTVSELTAALHAEDPIDRHFALFALGASGASEVAERLLSFLQSVGPAERWAAAISLAEMRDERVLPDLFAMLAHLAHDESRDDTGLLFWHWRLFAPRALAAWKRRDAVPYLRQALLAVAPVRELSTSPAERADQSEDIAQLQDEIVFALGRLGALGSLVGVSVPDATLRLWRVHLVMGYLYGNHRLTGKDLWRDNPRLRADAIELLEYCYGLDPQECANSLEIYDTERSFELRSMYEYDLSNEGDIAKQARLLGKDPA